MEINREKDAITIICKDTFVTVVEGRQTGSRQRYTSPVLDVFTSGVVRPATQQAVKYHAVAETLKRGGIALDVKRVNCNCGGKKYHVDPDQMDMFKDAE